MMNARIPATTLWRPILSLVLALLPVGGALAGERPTSLMVFGDSLSDVGNVSQATGGAFPGELYFDGRYSNGPLYAELLGFDLTHSFAGGSDYAIAGARTGDSLAGLPGQIASLVEATGGSVDPDTLCIVWIGGNDVIAGYRGGDRSGAVADLATALEVLGQSLSELFALGVEKMIVLNLPDLSGAPDVLQRDDPAITALARDLTEQWNSGLAQVVADLNQPGLQLFDVATVFEEIVATPALFGFVNLRDEAITAAGDDDQFLFWDGVHPTAAAHRLLAERMLADLPVLAPCAPRVSQISYHQVSQSVRIEFDSQPGARYAIESSTGLESGWTVLDGDYASMGESSTYVAPAMSRSSFYRIRALAP